MGALWFIVGLLVLVVGVGTAVMVTYVNRSSASSKREHAYRKAVAALEVRKAKALSVGDAFEVHVAEQEAVALRERYIAGKDLP